MYSGISASSGIGVGKAVVIKEEALVIRRENVADAEAEIRRFRDARDKAVEQTKVLAVALAAKTGEKEAEIIEGHRLLLQDPIMTAEIDNTIAEELVCG